MTAATAVIRGALGRIGADSVINPAPPETLVDAMSQLVMLLDEWRSVDFNVGAVNPETLADDLREFAGSRSAIEFALGLRMVGSLRKSVSPEFRAEANKSINTAREVFQLQAPPKIPKKHIRGQGAGY